MLVWIRRRYPNIEKEEYFIRGDVIWIAKNISQVIRGLRVPGDSFYQPWVMKDDNNH